MGIAGSGVASSTVGGMFPMSASSSYDCDDLSIAIYEQTQLYRTALDEFSSRLASIILDSAVDGQFLAFPTWAISAPPRTTSGSGALRSTFSPPCTQPEAVGNRC